MGSMFMLLSRIYLWFYFDRYSNLDVDPKNGDERSENLILPPSSGLYIY
jgi:hypothetical protein